MIDHAEITQIAQRVSLPPPLVLALSGKAPPEGLLASYGMDARQAKSDPAAALTVVAHAVAQSFAQHGSIEDALSHVFAGSPSAHQSPTSAAGGMVAGILGESAVHMARGWEGFTPSDAERFGKASKAMVPFLEETRAMGGAVTDETLAFWKQQTASLAPPKAAPEAPVAGADPSAPVPKGSPPKDVEAFAAEMKSLGIDVDHFMQHFPTYSALRYKMLASPTSLKDYVPVNGLQQSDMLSHVRNQPHPTYPHLTAGEYADAHDVASLHSWPHQGKPPEPSQVSRFASSGAKWGEVSNYYREHATNG